MMIRSLANLLSFGVPNPDRWSWRWFVGPVPLLVCVLAGFNAPAIDIFFRPIVVSFEVDADQSYRAGNTLFLYGSMELARKSGPNRCEFGAVVIRNERGEKLPYWFEKKKSRSVSTDRPDGPQEWGLGSSFLMWNPPRNTPA